MTSDETIRRIREILEAGEWPNGDKLDATDRDALTHAKASAEQARIRERIADRLAAREARTHG